MGKVLGTKFWWLKEYGGIIIWKGGVSFDLGFTWRGSRPFSLHLGYLSLYLGRIRNRRTW